MAKQGLSGTGLLKTANLKGSSFRSLQMHIVECNLQLAGRTNNEHPRKFVAVFHEFQDLHLTQRVAAEERSIVQSIRHLL